MPGVSERRRERVIARLQRGYATGALSTQTFERRLDCVLRAETPTALREAVRSAPKAGLLLGMADEHPKVIGRAPACDLVLSDDSVSRRHAMLVREGRRYFVTDLGSTNATYLNGRCVREAEVFPGDHLQLGDVHLVL